MNQSRHKHHHDLRHDGKLNKEEAVEEALRLDRDRQPVDVVQPHGRDGQRQSPRAPGQRPAAGPPVLGQSQTQDGAAVSGQRGERARVQSNPLRAAAPLLGQSNRPEKDIYNFTPLSLFYNTQAPPHLETEEEG